MKVREILRVLDELKLYWKGDTTLDYVYERYKEYDSEKSAKAKEEKK